MNNQMKDSRYLQTEEDLLMAFELICLEKDPRKITVAEIAKKTGVTRSTFYNHYQDMPQLIESIENRILDDLREVLYMLHVGIEYPEKITRTFFSTLCRYIKKSGYLIRQLKTLEGAEFIRKTIELLHNYVREITKIDDGSSPAQVQLQSYLMSYTIGGLLGILHKWASEDCADSSEAVAFLLSRVYLSGVSALIQSNNV